MEVSVVGLLCRTSDRTAGGARGAAALAEVLGERLEAPARLVGSPGEPRIGRWEEDIRCARGCLLEAGGQIEDAIGAGRTPVLCAAECSVCVTTLPTVARLVPGARVLWLDAHGDFNTPGTTRSQYLGGMCLAGACGRWPTSFPDTIDPAQIIMAGTRDIEAGEAAELDFAGVLRLEQFSDVVDAVDGSDLYVHLDLDVLDAKVFPGQFPTPGGLSVKGLARLLDEVCQAAQSVIGVEITCLEAPDDVPETTRLAELAADAVMPLLRQP